MKVRSEVQIRGIGEQEAKIGSSGQVYVTSTDLRRRGVSLQFVFDKSEPTVVVTVDADELKAAIENAVNLGG